MTNKTKAARSYSYMVKDLREKLSNGSYLKGDRLPTVIALSKAYGISGNSVRLGIDQLATEGTVSRRRGSGMYVEKITAPKSAPKKNIPSGERVGVYFDRWPRIYHPYYTELNRGIREAIEELGWSADWPVRERETNPWERKHPVVWENIDHAAFIAGLKQNTHISGAILTESFARNLGALTELPFPVVVPGLMEGHLSVGYDWKDELVTAVRTILRQGGRNILSIGDVGLAGSELLKRAAIAEGISPDKVRLNLKPVSGSGGITTLLIQNAFQETLTGLQEEPMTDSLVVSSDVLAQGAFDAVTSLGKGQINHITAMVSRESRIQSSHPYTGIVADGYLLGRTAVALLREHMQAPECAPRQQILRGEVRVY